MMGTDSNTLILAFAGGSISMLVLDYAYDLPYQQIINSQQHRHCRYAGPVRQLRYCAGSSGDRPAGGDPVHAHTGSSRSGGAA